MGLLVGHQDFSMLDLSTLPICDLADDGVYGMDLEEGNAEEAIMSIIIWSVVVALLMGGSSSDCDFLLVVFLCWL